MKKIRWNPEKSSILQENPDRGHSLELIADLIQAGAVLGIKIRPAYPDQQAFTVAVGEEVCGVPFRESEDEIFLITAWPERKLKWTYL
ncbi:MAG: toxin [bacterium]|nr:toxin [bacterium]